MSICLRSLGSPQPRMNSLLRLQSLIQIKFLQRDQLHRIHQSNFLPPCGVSESWRQEEEDVVVSSSPGQPLQDTAVGMPWRSTSEVATVSQEGVMAGSWVRKLRAGRHWMGESKPTMAINPCSFCLAPSRPSQEETSLDNHRTGSCP